MYYDYVFKGLSQEELRNVALKYKDKHVRKHAVMRLNDPETLKQIVLNKYELRSIREEAARRLAELNK